MCPKDAWRIIFGTFRHVSIILMILAVPLMILNVPKRCLVNRFWNFQACQHHFDDFSCAIDDFKCAKRCLLNRFWNMWWNFQACQHHFDDFKCAQKILGDLFLEHVMNISVMLVAFWWFLNVCVYGKWDENVSTFLRTLDGHKLVPIACSF